MPSLTGPHTMNLVAVLTSLGLCVCSVLCLMLLEPDSPLRLPTAVACIVVAVVVLAKYEVYDWWRRRRDKNKKRRATMRSAIAAALIVVSLASSVPEVSIQMPPNATSGAFFVQTATKVCNANTGGLSNTSENSAGVDNAIDASGNHEVSKKPEADAVVNEDKAKT